MSSKKSLTMGDIREMAENYVNSTKADFVKQVLNPYMLELEMNPPPKEIKKLLSPQYLTNKILDTGSIIMFNEMTPENVIMFMIANKNLKLEDIERKIDSYFGPYLGNEIMKELQKSEKEYKDLHKNAEENINNTVKRHYDVTDSINSSVSMLAKLGIEVVGPKIREIIFSSERLAISKTKTSNFPEEFSALLFNIDTTPVVNALLIKSSNVIFSNELDIENIDTRKLTNEDCCAMAEYVFQHKIQENMTPKSMFQDNQEERLLSIDNKTLEIVKPFREWPIDKRIRNIATMKRGLEMMEKRAAEREYSRA